MYKEKKGQTSVGKNGPWWAKMLDGPWWARMTAREARRTRIEAPLHSLVDAEVGRKMDLAQQEWTLWWAKMDRGGQERSVAQEARRTRERLCTRSMRLVIRMVGEGL